jgi:hypothetical protein
MGAWRGRLLGFGLCQRGLLALRGCGGGESWMGGRVRWNGCEDLFQLAAGIRWKGGRGAVREDVRRLSIFGVNNSFGLCVAVRA